MNAASVVWTIKGGGDTQTLLAVKKLNFLHSQVVGMQKLAASPRIKAQVLLLTTNEPPAGISLPYFYMIVFGDDEAEC